jgi:rRNA processing protein Krr1/Pno1
VGAGSKKSTVERGARRTNARRLRRTARQESTLEMMERLLTRRVLVSVSGQPKQVSAAEAIVLQLMQKAMSGNARAWRALLQYQQFANRHSDKTLDLRFVESEYTRAFAKSSSRNDDD